MNTTNHPRRSFAWRRTPRGNWRAVAMALALGVSINLLGGCAFTPTVLTTPGNPVPVGEVFPAALLAEPIQLRAGYVHTTQPFQIKGPKERWAVALGFVRTDTNRPIEKKVDGAYDVCWTDAPGEGFRPKCNITTPGFSLRWELLREDGKMVTQYKHDNLVERSGGTYGATAITRTLSGFGDQGVGSYRLRVIVLRDGKELDFLKPHILVNRPFFSSRSIE
ncbi:hypothetical protein [Variovorax boronicumulans]|uniref:hypothetical protein n=1 Tax=Variovorax boronicumulans TaxID=436515 RepID=UPI003395F23B